MIGTWQHDADGLMGDWHLDSSPFSPQPRVPGCSLDSAGPTQEPVQSFLSLRSLSDSTCSLPRGYKCRSFWKKSFSFPGYGCKARSALGDSRPVSGTLTTGAQSAFAGW